MHTLLTVYAAIIIVAITAVVLLRWRSQDEGRALRGLALEPLQDIQSALAHGYFSVFAKVHGKDMPVPRKYYFRVDHPELMRAADEKLVRKAIGEMIDTNIGHGVSLRDLVVYVKPSSQLAG